MNNDIKYRNKTINEITSIDINKIRTDALNMADESIFDLDLTNLSIKYEYLYNNLLSLFTKIYKDKNDQKEGKERINKDGIKAPFVFNKYDFENSLEIILNQFSKVQNKNLKIEDNKTHEDLRKKFDSKYLNKKWFK